MDMSTEVTANLNFEDASRASRARILEARTRHDAVIHEAQAIREAPAHTRHRTSTEILASQHASSSARLSDAHTRRRNGEMSDEITTTLASSDA